MKKNGLKKYINKNIYGTTDLLSTSNYECKKKIN